jgi:hypothetical protein
MPFPWQIASHLVANMLDNGWLVDGGAISP